MFKSFFYIHSSSIILIFGTFYFLIFCFITGTIVTVFVDVFVDVFFNYLSYELSLFLKVFFSIIPLFYFISYRLSSILFVFGGLSTLFDYYTKDEQLFEMYFNTYINNKQYVTITFAFLFLDHSRVSDCSFKNFFSNPPSLLKAPFSYLVISHLDILQIPAFKHGSDFADPNKIEYLMRNSPELFS